MNAVTSDQTLVGTVRASELTAGLRQSVSAGMKTWPLLTILTIFWVYVALSNVLYAHTMQVSLSAKSPGNFFAHWDARVLQHLFMYPFLIVCVVTSMRIGWQPSWRALPQLLLALFFAAIAAPFLMLGEMLTSSMDDWKHEQPHTVASFFSGPEP